MSILDNILRKIDITDTEQTIRYPIIIAPVATTINEVMVVGMIITCAVIVILGTSIRNRIRLEADAFAINKQHCRIKEILVANDTEIPVYIHNHPDLPIAFATSDYVCGTEEALCNKGILLHEVGHVVNNDIHNIFSYIRYSYLVCFALTVGLLMIDFTNAAVTVFIGCVLLPMWSIRLLRRRMERRADKYATDKGYGKALVAYLISIRSTPAYVNNKTVLLSIHPTTESRILACRK